MDETSRIAFTKTMLTKYSDLLHARRDPLDKSVESLRMIFDLISPQFDTDCFIKLVKSGYFILQKLITREPGVQPDYVYGDKYSSKALTGRRGSVLSLSGSARPGSANTSVLLDRLCSSDATQEDEEIIALPLKQGKKKASERIKLIAKELPGLSAKAIQFEKLVEVQERERNMNSQVCISEQRLAIGSAVYQLLARKTKLETYLGKTSDDAAMYASISAQASPESSFGSSKKKKSAASLAGPKPTADANNSRGSVVSSRIESKQSLNEGSRASVAIVKARALFDFEGAPDTDEMDMKTDELFAVLEQLDDGWFQCIGKDGRTGLLPGNYLEIET
jgi:hypothetical protein